MTDFTIVEDPLLTPREAAAQFGVREKTVRGWMQLRQIAYVKMPGGRRGAVRIRLSTIQRLLKEWEVEPLYLTRRRPAGKSAEVRHESVV